ncbi:MAG TPA: hypothetical protein VHG51_11005 [Longimicrobiaceae bacterium]|nr:hypothetical protein [Longimicrobiaceae bacterium]
MRAPLFLLATALLAGCGSEGPPGAAGEPGDTTVPGVTARADPPAGWRWAPTEGVALRGADTLLVETGPHLVLWREGQEPLVPPYTVRARMQKLHGRLHEGYGIVFGGEGLEGPEEAQRYSYFLVRGDGSFLVKRRAGPETPVVRPWTTHSSIRRDTEEGGLPNQVEVQVAADSVRFLVNGAEVAAVPASEVDVRGVPGLRVAHQVQLQLSGFAVEPGAAERGATR